MKPDVKRILAKLSKEKVELATEKIELAARKPQALLKNAKKLNLEIDKAKNKINKVWVVYEKAYNQWQQFLRTTESSADEMNTDIGFTMDALADLGVDFTNVKELGMAQDIVNKIEQDSKSLRTLYGKPL